MPMTADPIQDMKTKMKQRDQAYAKAHRLSAELWDLVETSDLSVSEIARALGITRAAVYQWRKRKVRQERSV